MRTLIVGTGIGGLTLATLLKEQGNDVVVIDKTPVWKSIGFMLGILPNGVRILEKLGIAEALTERSVVVPSYVLKDEDGHVLGSTNFRALRKRYGPVLEVERDALHTALLSLNTGTDIRMATTLTKVEETESGVVVTFSDGTRDMFDLVVGADGINSSVRSFIRPTVHKKQTGTSFWLTWIHGIDEPESVTFYAGDGKGLALFPCKGDRAAALFLIPRGDVPTASEDRSAFLRKTFAEMGDLVPDILAKLPPSAEIFQNDIEEMQTHVWRTDRIALLGDAVHALSPLVYGVGASLAMEDATVLAEEVARGTSITQALTRYERRRSHRLRALIRWSWMLHRLVNVGGFWSRIRNLAFRRWFATGTLRALRTIVSIP